MHRPPFHKGQPEYSGKGDCISFAAWDNLPAEIQWPQFNWAMGARAKRVSLAAAAASRAEEAKVSINPRIAATPWCDDFCEERITARVSILMTGLEAVTVI
jgi:hypothetical protein